MPFFQPESELSETKKSAAEEALKAARDEASSSVGEMVAAGQDFTHEKVQECSHVVSAAMPRMGYRTHRSYATVLAFSYIVINLNFSTNTLFLLFTLVYIVYSISWLKTPVLYPMMRYHGSPLQFGFQKCSGFNIPPATLLLILLGYCQKFNI